jgi:16S rRNA processing protein RimM
VLAKLEGCNDRNAAEELVGALITVPRAALPDTSLPGEYYWADLVGLAVKTTDDVDLGRIDHLFETGSNDVMVVQGDRERLVPYIWKQVVLEVDLKAGEMLVDWDPEF